MSRVVIIGMGDTGVLTASRLRDVDVIGIAASPGLVSGQELGLRITRPALWARDYLIGYDRFKALDNVELVYGEATGLDPSRRELHVGERIVGYDVLVIASGTANGFWRQPTNKSLAEIETELAQTQQRLAGAGHVAVIGGGASAVSAAFNLSASGKSVTLCFPGERPLQRHHPRVWAHLAGRAERLGLTFLPHHRAVAPNTALSPGPVQFVDGTHLGADLVLWAIGPGRPHSDFVPREWLDDGGFVRVEPTLQVPGHPEVFAIGDVAATDPLRSSARNWAFRLLARNIAHHLAGRPLQDYKPPRNRWGSVIGPQEDGLTVYSPAGKPSRIARYWQDRLIQPFVVRRMIYGGVRPKQAR